MKIILIMLFFVVQGFSSTPLNQKELEVFKAMVSNEIQSNIKNGVNDIDLNKYIENLIRVDASTIQKDYESNEVSADMKYSGKMIALNGIVDGIKKDMMGNLIVSFKTNNFIGVNAIINKDYLKWVSSLSKGDKEVVICSNSRFILSSVSVEKCVPLDEWSKLVSISFADNLNKMIENKIQPFFQLSKVAKRLTPRLKPDSECFNDNYSKCIEEIWLLIKALQKEKGVN